MKVIISGGGIAGLSAAGVLAQRGHDVRVFERREGPSTLGAGIVSFPNATRVLRSFGLEEEVRGVAGTPRTMRRMSDRGERLGDLPLSVINERLGAPSYSILRADLHEILTRFAEQSGATVEYSRRVTGVAEGGAVLLSDGRRLEADWVLGADGRMSSPLRKFVLGDNQARYGGFVSWIGVARSAEHVFDPHTVLDVWGCGERFGIVPISSRLAYFAGAAAMPRAAAHRSSIGPMLAERFSAWPQPVQETIRCADADSLREIYVHDHDPIDLWHRQRVLLIGDAAHAPLPTSGQGACQALEDAWHLGRLLDDGVPQAPSELFPRFTAVRREKANAIIGAGRGFAAMLFNPDPAFVSERNRRSRQTNFAEAAQGMAKLWAGALG
ncbi:monooxygenase [Sorangium cellulosum]|uniref:Monooxygenase n=1 Tax=Sorangium cellulosum TaxID=56 RepID=A0A4P2QB29_SORCE|nr:FAD-dependent monooxygenase [Sorangium cellulosum]AUX26521.1 monooxygenase [Sorangium cellulosum]